MNPNTQTLATYTVKSGKKIRLAWVVGSEHPQVQVLLGDVWRPRFAAVNGDWAAWLLDLAALGAATDGAKNLSRKPEEPAPEPAPEPAQPAAPKAQVRSKAK